MASAGQPGGNGCMGLRAWSCPISRASVLRAWVLGIFRPPGPGEHVRSLGSPHSPAEEDRHDFMAGLSYPSSRQLPTSVFFPRVPPHAPPPPSIPSANLPPPTHDREAFCNALWAMPHCLSASDLCSAIPSTGHPSSASPNSPPQSAAAALKCPPTGYCGLPGHLPVPPPPPDLACWALQPVFLYDSTTQHWLKLLQHRGTDDVRVLLEGVGAGSATQAQSGDAPVPRDSTRTASVGGG